MKNYDVAIIGGGSAGIASAISAYDNGIKNIVIFEKDDHLGGILLQCIHNGFGLHRYQKELSGPEYAFLNVKELLERNIEVKLKTTVLDISESLQVTYSSKEEGYQTIFAKAIICATGCLERTRGQISIPGDRMAGIMTAGLAQKYINIDGYMVGKRIFILGSGDIGLIMARRLVLEGAEVLGVAELMPYSNGLSRNVVQCLMDFNIPLYLSTTVKRVIGKDRLEKIVLAKVDESYKFIEGSEQVIEADTLLLSVGLLPLIPLLTKINVKVHPKTRGPVVDESYMTSIPGIFACGNSLHVHDLVDFVSIESEKAGKAAAEYILCNTEKSGKVMEIVPRTGLNYTLPSKVHLEHCQDFSVNFRVNKPYYNVFVRVLLNNKEIKKIKKPFMLPGEMETIRFTTLELDSGIMEIEVCDA